MNKQWNAVILAGDRGLSDPVASVAGVEGKAFAKLQDTTLIERMISVLHECDSVNEIYTVGPSQKYLADNAAVQSFIEQHNVCLLEPAPGPSASAMRGIMRSSFYPTLLVTCDLALLSSEVLDQYCKTMIDINADFVASAIDYQKVHEKIPELKKTQYQFGNKVVCFANVFAVLGPDGLKAIDYWQEIEKSRKKPIQLIRKIDWLSLLQYKLGRLSLDQVALKLSEKVGARLKVQCMPNPELAIDVDSAHDYQVMQKFLAE